MNRRLFLVSAAFLACVALMQAVLAITAAQPTGARLLSAATTLFDSLSDEQKKAALFEFSSEERFNWHFIPKERKGLPLKDMQESQRANVTAVLEAGLSKTGAKRAQNVMSLEDVLREIEGPKRRFPRDPLLYHVYFFGKPSRSDRWGFRFEGHHLSASFTLLGTDMLSATPLFYGANPGLVTDGPKKGLRVLAGEEDLARALVTSLSEEQLKSARGEGDPEEVPGTEKAKYTGPFPPGIGSDTLSRDQKEALRKLLKQYSTSLSDDVAATLLREADGELKDLHFSWRGGLKSGEAHSYMVYSPAFMINYINAQNNALHVHSCLRLLNGEFGL